MAKRKSSETPLVVLEGHFFAWHSLAHVNRELARSLSNRTTFDFAINALDANSPEAGTPYSKELRRLQRKNRKPDLKIRHAFPPDLSEEENVVLMQPWEFIEAPAAWVEFVDRNAIELWVPSRFARESFIRSGLSPRKVRVLPLGYDDSICYRVESEEPKLGPFRFIYVGGTIERKGADILLNAYSTEFRQDEAVELVIKDFGTKHVYRHNNLKSQIIANKDTPGPQVTYIDENLQPLELANLYRTADCLVQPYRAEGFCIPALEAMACGLPVIVTSGGPTDDFVGQSMGWHVSGRRVQIGQIPGLASSGGQGWLEPSVDDLRLGMREAFEDRAHTRQLGRNGAEFVKTNYTWVQIGHHYAARIEKLLADAAAKRSLPSPTLSLCMIARDEESIIVDCLSSARPFVDEIVLVDTGSSDRTKDVSAKYVDKLVDFAWVDDFSAARNESLKHATGDWIIWLDADDTLPEETGRAIRSAIASAPPNIMAFIVPVRFPDGSPSGGTVVDHVKVIRRVPGISFEGRIHEQILPSIRQLGGEVARIQGFVNHANYDYSASGQEKKRNRDKKLLELDLQERPDHPFVLFNMGMTDHYNGDHESALQWLERSIKVAQPEESHVRKAYSLRVGSIDRLGRKEQALRVTTEALSLFPADAELLFLRARLQDELGDPLSAIETYKQVLVANPSNHFSSFDHAILSYKTYHNVAGLYAKIRDYHKARDFWLQAIASAPTFVESLVNLFNNAVEVGDEGTAKLTIEHIQEHRLGYELWRNMAATWLQTFRTSTESAEFLAAERNR